ncbi:hypothetical protein FQR65_LT00240 [Abscondita terminalis]|nr:hypothetical protein FQR65_LT00240 [Abscondita terminalis]
MWISVLISFATIFSYVYVYLRRSWTFWKNRDVYTPPPRFPFGNVNDLIAGKLSFGEKMAQLYFEFKKNELRFGGFYFVQKPNLLLVDLDLIKLAMTKDFEHFTDRSAYVNEKKDLLSAHLFALQGEKWKNLRAKLTPTFTSGKMKTMFPILVKCGRGLKDLIDGRVDGHPIDIKDAFARYTTDVIGSAAFGIECDSLKKPESQFRKYGSKITDTDFYGSVKRFLGFSAPKVLEFFNVKVLRKDVNDFFINVVNETVNYREANDEKRNDFMQLLIEMKNDGKTLTIDEIAAQAFVFFQAGFETSSTTLTFCCYELAQKIEVQERLRQEINAVLKRHGFVLTYESLKEMTYMDQCINETLRVYPPAPSITRKCTKTYKIPEVDVVIEKGTTIHIPIMGIQRDPDFYPNPLDFDPDRFSSELKNQRHPFSWFPFGEGPRVCIGMRFAIMQTKVALVEVLRNFKVTLSDRTVAPITLNPRGFLLNTKENVWMDVEKIKHQGENV